MNNIEKVMTGFYTENVKDNEDKVAEPTKSFNFYTNVKVSSKLQFVDNVVSNIIVEGNYYSLLRDIIFDIMLIQHFSDVDVTDIIEKGVDAIEDYLSSNNIVEIMKINMGDDLLRELNESVDFNIEYKTGVHNNDISHSISSLLKVLETKINNIDTEGMMTLAKQLTNMTGDLSTDKIVEAYTKTDMFRGNQAAILDEKNKKIKELEEIIKNGNSSKNS